MITPEFRVSYAHVFSPQKNDLNGEMEYSIVAIFPKGTDLAPMKAAAQAVLTEKFGADQAKWPTNLRNPFRKCSERWKNENGKQIVPAGYEDGEAIFVSMKSKAKNGKPAVVDASVEPIIEPSAFYSGCFALASANPYYYDQKGNRGISFGLNNVQKVRDGEPLGGRASAQADFKPIAGAEKASSGAGAKSVFDE